MRALLALVVLAFLAACGDGTGSNAAPTATPTSTPTPLATATQTAASTDTPTPTQTCNTPATPKPDRTCSLTQCQPGAPCVIYGHDGYCNDAGPSGCECIPEGTRTMTQAPCSTPTPTLTLFTYTLVEGSSLATGQGGPEPLTGTFTVFENPEYIPNTLFDYRIRAVDFQAGALTIRGGSPPLPPPGELPYSGWLSAVTFDPRPHQVYANMWLLIDDEPVALGGGGYVDSPILPPAFHGLELCGLPANRAVSCDQIRSGAESGYILTLSAVPVASLPTPTPTVDCFENVGGCCDFWGQKPCYPLVYGADAAQCLNRDSGSPRGCHGSVTCNLTTGLCEDQAS